MKFKMTPTKIFAVLLLGIVTFSFTMSSLDAAITNYERQNNHLSDLPNHLPDSSNESLISQISGTESQPLAYLFQILMILFVISPPTIAILLFLIWRELKIRNKMK